MHADEEIFALAKDAVLCLTRSPRPGIPPPFRFLDLPKGIQLSILEFTALITYLVTYRSNGFDYRVKFHKDGSIAENNDPMCVDYRPLLQCLCGYSHSAFNFRCNCKDKIFPSSMLLVSHEFRHAARQVFYGQNKFIVPMEESLSKVAIDIPPSLRLDGEDVEETADPFEVSVVPRFANFSHSSIKYLTKPNLDFPWRELEYLQPKSNG